MVSTINKWIVQEYCEAVKDKDGVVLLSMEGLSVEEALGLRNSVRATGASLVMGKKRLVRVALSESGIEFDDAAWEMGNCALLVGDAESAIGASKAIEAFCKPQKEKRKISYRAAYFDGSVMPASEAAGIAGMPDKNTLRSMLCGALNGPGRQLAVLLKEVGASTARCLQARADQEDAA
ncbi:MAG: 50S ribosomal protein L10 [Planctomycetes bacterium]|nr:50S ribosomal protein L10 [Planctomycetota bacterium]